MEKIDDGDYTASTASFSPSFSTYAGDNLVKIAKRVGDDHYYKEKGDASFEFATLQTVHEPASYLVFPVFDHKHEDVASLVTPSKDLFLRESEQSPPQQTYSSSDEEDELNMIASEIYCPWTPVRSPVEMSSPCRKANRQDRL